MFTQIPAFIYYPEFIIIYFAFINLVTLFLFGWDKMMAKSQGWRIKEKTLLILAILGGSVGAIVGMNTFHHKTKKSSFLALFVIILVLQISAVYYFMFN